MHAPACSSPILRGQTSPVCPHSNPPSPSGISGTTHSDPQQQPCLLYSFVHLLLQRSRLCTAFPQPPETRLQRWLLPPSLTPNPTTLLTCTRSPHALASPLSVLPRHLSPKSQHSPQPLPTLHLHVPQPGRSSHDLWSPRCSTAVSWKQRQLFIPIWHFAAREKGKCPHLLLVM